MKKLVSIIFTVMLLMASVSANASDNYFYSDGLYQISGQVIGVCEMEEIIDEEAVGGAYYVLTIDTNSTIMFETPVDTLSISEPEKGGYEYFNFADGVIVSDDACSVNYSSAFRNDSQEYYSLDVDLENEIEYMKENASIRFNKPGTYLLTATLGAADGYERVNQLVQTTYRDDTYYSQPTVTMSVTVKDQTSSESVDNISYYDENVFSISGITGYDETRTVMNDNIVALCTSPTVITASNDLTQMEIVKLENINGVWTETRFYDKIAINLGDINKNWYPAEGFENVQTDYYEFTGTEEYYDIDEAIVKKGTSVTITEPGMYMVWGDSQTGEGTGLTFEIRDTVATYTNSKVLVDGKQIKFEAYNINDNNYFKLRDIAYALTNYGTGARIFNVKWDGERNMINLLSDFKYDAVGGELKEGDGMNKRYKLSSSALIKDGKNVTLTAYNINDNNYFKLRDLGKLFDFNVSWDGANNCILIDTTCSYRE